MKTKPLIAGLFAAITVAGAYANDQFNGEAHYQLPQPSTSTLTRAEVKAQLAQAQAAGEISYDAS